MKKIMIGLVLAAALAPAMAQAASFDCDRARAADEKAICASRPLNDKDVRMALLYEINRKTLAMGGREALEDAQHQWLRERRSCGPRRACLDRAYDRRLDELQRGLERIYRNGPF
ncbi:lysozyme inhibitor LprI family protein [Caulobacter sp. LARHSG274]